MELPKIHDQFHLLHSVSPLVALALPSREDLEKHLKQADPATAEAQSINDVDATVLRTRVHSVPLWFNRFEVGGATDFAAEVTLTETLDSTLSIIEQSVTCMEGVLTRTQKFNNPDLIAQFPKLIAIQGLPQQQIFRARRADEATIHNAEIRIDLSKDAFVRINSETLRKNHAVFGQLEGAMAKLIPLGTWQPNVDGLLEEFSPAESQIIQEANTFRTAAKALFLNLVNCVRCDTKHTARLHLSGFHLRQLEMLLGSGDNDWIRARFALSTTAVVAEQDISRLICDHTSGLGSRCRTIKAYFDDNVVWRDENAEESSNSHMITENSLNTLSSLLQSSASQEQPRLNTRSRSVVGVLLACSFFRLCNSPWLQYGFDRDTIMVLEQETNLDPVSSFRPHISCNLLHDVRSRPVAEDVASLGVLVLELATRLKAGWTKSDEYYGSSIQSNRLRLRRILQDWSGEVPECYRNIGSACLRFDQLVDELNHQDIRDKDSRSLAVLYKCIVNPLFQRLMKDFPEAESLFEGVSGLSVPARRKVPPVTRRLVLYDDAEATEPTEHSERADELIVGWMDNFAQRMNRLRPGLYQTGLAEKLSGVPRKPRIAVLDTGIDPEDGMIKPALKRSRIVKMRSWVDASPDCTDRYGHGTHVTRLLLKLAPSSDIYVAKITHGKELDPSNLSRIAEAIDWAVEECKVDIITMSFGFENKNKDIEKAIERAFKNNTLMFAAASNPGANKKRSHPARSPRVICMHACDAHGNRGGMNPNPEEADFNFTTLGVAVESKWAEKTVYKSGTSFSTPISAAFAANILEFANFRPELSEYREDLCKRDEMVKVFKLISTVRDGYRYVQPDFLWGGDLEDNEIAAKLLEVLDA